MDQEQEEDGGKQAPPGSSMIGNVGKSSASCLRALVVVKLLLHQAARIAGSAALVVLDVKCAFLYGTCEELCILDPLARTRGRNDMDRMVRVMCGTRDAPRDFGRKEFAIT